MARLTCVPGRLLISSIEALYDERQAGEYDGLDKAQEEAQGHEAAPVGACGIHQGQRRPGDAPVAEKPARGDTLHHIGGGKQADELLKGFRQCRLEGVWGFEPYPDGQDTPEPAVLGTRQVIVLKEVVQGSGAQLDLVDGSHSGREETLHKV